MPSDGPASGPQNLLDEKILRSEVSDLQCMNGHVVDDACCCQHGVTKDCSEASPARAENRAIPSTDRISEGEGDGCTMDYVLNGVSFLTAAKLAGAKPALEASRSEEAVTYEANRCQHQVGLKNVVRFGEVGHDYLYKGVAVSGRKMPL